MDNGKIIVVIVAILALVTMSYAPEITGHAYSRTLGRTETGTTPILKQCTSNEDCPEGYACRSYGALQRLRKKARTACVPICEDAERNRIPFELIETLKASHDLARINGFDPYKPRPTRYRPINSFETFLYTSNCKDTTILVEPFCVDATANDATVATVDIDCGVLGEGFTCVEDDNGEASCGQPGEEEDVQRLYTATSGTETIVEKKGEQDGEEKEETPSEAAPEKTEEPEPNEQTSVEIRDFQFVPATITIPANTPAPIVVKNSGNAPHTFTIDALEINEELAAGTEKTVTITATAGSYRGQCDFHPSMSITVTVQ